jgi:hypothetical protein
MTLASTFIARPPRRSPATGDTSDAPERAPRITLPAAALRDKPRTRALAAVAFDDPHEGDAMASTEAPSRLRTGRRRVRDAQERRHARRGARHVPVDHARALRRGPIEAEYLRIAPDPGDFPKLVDKLKQLDTTDFRLAGGGHPGDRRAHADRLGDSDRSRRAAAAFREAPAGAPRSQAPETAPFVGKGAVSTALLLIVRRGRLLSTGGDARTSRQAQVTRFARSGSSLAPSAAQPGPPCLYRPTA